MSDDGEKVARHRAHNDGHGEGVTYRRLERGAVMLEIWTPPTSAERAPFFSDVMSSAEWVDTVAAMIVGDEAVSASDLQSLRSDIARLHERWRGRSAASEPTDPDP